MSDLSPDLELKISNVMDEIHACDLEFDEKTFLQEKVLQAKACANGSTNKIDDMSKVLLHSTLHQVKSEVRMPAKISKLVREELKETEKNIAKNTVEAINNHTNECFRRMESFQSQFVPEKNIHCIGCDGKGAGDGEEDTTDETKEKKTAPFGLRWIQDLIIKYPIQAGFLLIVLFERYGLENIIKLVGMLIGAIFGAK